MQYANTETSCQLRH